MHHPNYPSTTTEDAEYTGWLRENRVDADTVSRFRAEDQTIVVVLYYVTHDYLKGPSLRGRMLPPTVEKQLDFQNKRTSLPLTEPSVQSLNINTGLISLGEEKEAEL